MSELSLFRSAPDASMALCRLAELLFRQVQLFGQLSVNQGTTRGQIDHALMSAGGITPFLELLEAQAALRFGSYPLPYCYNRSDWSKDCPAGGYTSDALTPPPHQVLMSLFLAWNLPNPGVRTITFSARDREITSTGQESSLVERLVRSALAVVRDRGFESGVDYLFDLLKAGYIIETRSLYDAFKVLLLGQSQTESDADFLTKFFAGKVPESNAEFIDADIDYAWLRSELPMEVSSSETADSSVKADRVEISVTRMIEATLDEVQRVRQVNSLDEWVPGQITLGGRINVLNDLVAEFSGSMPLPLKAVMSQLEEIRADAGALTNVLTAHYGVPSYFDEGGIGFVEHVAEQYRATVGDDWEERFFTERLLVPQELRSAVLPEWDASNRPERWNSLSWMVAQPLCHALRNQQPVVAAAAAGDTSLELRLLAEPRVPAALSITGLIDIGRFLRIPAVVEWVQRYALTSESDQEKLLWYAINARGEFSVPEGAKDLLASLTSLSLAHADRPGMTPSRQRVDDLDPKQVKAMDGAVWRKPRPMVSVDDYTDLLSAYILGEIEHAIDETTAGRYDKSIEALQYLRNIFPWDPFVYSELAIAVDKKGDPHRALELMIPSIVLNPRSSLAWQSLSVILARLEADQESLLAQAMSLAIAQVERKYALS